MGAHIVDVHQVLVAITLLVERLRTVLALVRLFACVYAHVAQHITTTSNLFVTSINQALEMSHVFASLWIFGNYFPELIWLIF